jgi:hypothetical protein
MVSKAVKNCTLWLWGGMIYYLIEVAWRGYSHPSMFVVGGLCFLLLGGINNWLPWNLGIVWQCLIGAVSVTAVELVSGLILNTFLGLKVALTNLVPEVKPEVVPPPTATLPTLKKGSKGNDVKTLQAALNKYGYKLTADGDFGKLTDAAVRDFQLGHGLSADGIVGAKTWAALGA